MPEIVIVGGGIIGLCTAYYLLSSPNPPRVTIIESTSIACAASSKAAGFVAGGAGWHGAANVELARLSWKAFEELAKEYDGANRWGWRICTTTGVKIGSQGKMEMSAYRQLPVGGTPKGAKWANGEHVGIADAQAGQLMPDQFCAAIYDECTRRGLRTLIATPVSRRGKTIKTTAGDVAYDKLVLAAGPWTKDLCATLDLPLAPIGSLPGHSIQIAPAASYNGKIPNEAIFCGVNAEGDAVSTIAAGTSELHGWEREQGWTRMIEFFPRADGNVYGAGENAIPAPIGDAAIDGRENRLPASAGDVHRLVDKDLVQRMLRAATAVSPALDTDKGAKLVKADLCFRPVTADKMPLIGRWAGDAYICAGHGPWGITLGPGSGIVMAELLLASLDGRTAKTSVDIAGLAPQRFGPVRNAKL